MKVLFLDFDGVLNDCRLSAASQGYWDNPLQAEYVARLNRIIAATGAKVVLCTSWRTFGREGEGQAACESQLRARGFAGEIVGATPDLSPDALCYGSGTPPRWKEIKAWLDGHPDVTEYLILDDIPNMGPLGAWHIAPVDGLTEDDTALAIDVLG